MREKGEGGRCLLILSSGSAERREKILCFGKQGEEESERARECGEEGLRLVSCYDSFLLGGGCFSPPTSLCRGS